MRSRPPPVSPIAGPEAIIPLPMKTTLELPAPLVRCLEERAAATGATVSEIVEQAVRRLLSERPFPGRPPTGRDRPLPDLPSAPLGCRLDPADREALYEAMEDPPGFLNPTAPGPDGNGE